ncbi:MAG: hypothetical protein H6667_19530 [Ardenticatenaceae bacterium]|nr:hypothetical protein [Ardenticatenaceae bacterium]MCB9446229.1 hypothetical protein [Ardenticatenaceae bacterium]
MIKFRRLAAVLAVIGCLVFGGILLVKSPVRADTSSVAAVETAVSTSFSYQGRLKRGGTPYTGSCAFRFDLWDAAVAGTKKGTVNLPNVPVTEGLFAVELDFGDQFQGQERWLETAVQCPGDANFTSMGRESLTAVPYALGLRPGLTVESQTDNGLRGIANAQYRAGLVGLNNGSGGYGVYGASSNGSGVAGFSDNWIGVYGETDVAGSTGAAGVWGRANGVGGVGVVGYATQSDSIGVKGAANVSGGVGVWGESNQNTGVYGVSTSWAGVWGQSANASGVYGLSNGQYSGGVYGVNTNGGFGVYGKSANGAGVYGQSTAWYGVVGISENQTGVYGRSTNGLAGDFDGRLRSKVVEITGGSDLAERFAVSGGETAVPGTVMVIDPDNPGHLMSSSSAYDRKVAGVVSGAGDVQPGLTLHQEGVLEGDTVVAIAGRVYVLADVSNGPIQPGDMLTTSDTPGHVMKATDLDLAQGAVLGKAMTALDSGTGLVLVLVNLQ